MSKVLENFISVSKIPRPSHHEEKISAFLEEFGKSLGYKTKRDDYNNVVIRKPASKGYELYKGIGLQAHIDMVCEKAKGVEHNFLEDPIPINIENGIVSTKGKTTLGADNGLGVATIMSILEDRSLSHPEIEAIFTTDEEDSFTGAKNIDFNSLNSKFIINLDHADDSEILCSAAGGITFLATSKFTFEKIPTEYKAYSIFVEGLKGGHSGEDINKGRGNSNVILFRLLDRISKFDMYINNIKGGSYRLALPRNSKIDISIKSSDVFELNSEINKFFNEVKKEFKSDEETFKIGLNENSFNDKGIHISKFLNVIDYILLSPDGISQMSNVFENLIDASSNLGEIYFKNDTLHIITDIRASYDSEMDHIIRKLEKLSNIYNLSGETFGKYFSWEYKENSELRKVVKEVYDKNNDRNTKVLGMHCGLECGFFSNNIENLDILSIGANAWDFHSPSEGFSIESLNHFYKNVVEIIKNAKFKEE